VYVPKYLEVRVAKDTQYCQKKDYFYVHSAKLSDEAVAYVVRLHNLFRQARLLCSWRSNYCVGDS
jgi:hypothetical protein